MHSPHWIAYAVAATLLLMFLFYLTLPETKNTRTYTRKSPFLNGYEQILFARLKEAMPDHHIMAQVRLADIIEARQGVEWQMHFNKISRKSVDFIICEHDFNILAAIELDGKTHENEKRKYADKTKDDALEIAGISMTRFRVDKIPSVRELQRLFL